MNQPFLPKPIVNETLFVHLPPDFATHAREHGSAPGLYFEVGHHLLPPPQPHSLSAPLAQVTNSHRNLTLEDDNMIVSPTKGGGAFLAAVTGVVAAETVTGKVYTYWEIATRIDVQ